MVGMIWVESSEGISKQSYHAKFPSNKQTREENTSIYHNKNYWAPAITEKEAKEQTGLHPGMPMQTAM